MCPENDISNSVVYGVPPRMHVSRAGSTVIGRLRPLSAFFFGVSRNDSLKETTPWEGNERREMP